MLSDLKLRRSLPLLLRLQMADFHALAILAFSPVATFVAGLTFVEINLTPPFAVKGLIGEIMTTDAHILAKAYFGICWKPKRDSEHNG